MSDFNLTLSPAQLEVVIKPGASLTQAYEVTNNSNDPVTLTPSVEYWTPVGSDGSVIYCQEQCPYPPNSLNFTLANSNLQLDQPFTLAPHQSLQLVLKLKVPSDALYGDYYTTFFLSQVTANSSQNQPLSAQATGKIGSHLLVSLSQTSQNEAKADIKYLRVSPRLKDIFFGRIRFQSEITNTSQYYFAPVGHITITKNGRELKKLPLAPQNILASHSRQVRCLTSQPTDSKSPVSLTDCTLSPPFWPGIYTATIKLNDPVKSQPVSVNFFVFPYYLTLTLIVMSLTAYFLLLHHKNKRQ